MVKLKPVPAPPADGQLPNEIMCPLTGELVAIDDADGLIDTFERCKKKVGEIHAVIDCLKLHLLALTEGDQRTRRVRGQRRVAKLEMASDGWEQSVLREAWNSYPQHRELCLKIGTINVAMREYKKLVGTSGPPDFNAFRNMISAAVRPATALPTVTVEK